MSVCNSPSKHDRGLAWIVLISSFLLQMVIDGILSSYGFLHPSMTQDYDNVTTSELILPGSLQSGFYQLSAALSAVLSNQFGMHVVASIGSVISCISLVGAAYIENLSIFSCLFGVTCGIGLSFMYVPAIVSVNLYFKRLRPLASGLSMTGSGFGYMLIPLLMKYLVMVYGWRDSIKIISGLFAICLCCSLCLRPFVEVVEPPEIVITREYIDTDDPKQHLEYRDEPCKLNEGDTEEKLSFFPPFLLKNESLQSNHYTSMPTMIRKSDTNHPPFKSETHLNKNEFSKSSNLVVVPPLSQRDIFYSGLLPSIPVGSCEEVSNLETDDASVNDVKRGFWQTFLASFDLNLFREMDFVLLVSMAVLVQLAYFIAFVYLIDFASTSKNISADHLTLLALSLGISHTIGRVTAGLLANMKRLHPLHLSFASIFLCGISSLSVPFCTTVYLLATYAAVQGFALAVTAVMQPLLLVKYIGIKKLTTAFGNLTMLKGFASFGGPPAAALLYQLTGYYNSVFLWAGGCYMAALIPHIPFYFKLCRQPSDNTSDNTETQTV